ncbi:MAG: MarR family transcriptional regulator [Candidatus Korobacteraceae bacterium]
MSGSKPVKPADYQALAEFRYQIRRFVRFSEEAARKGGIEPQHHQLLLALKGKPDHEEPRIAFIAERLQIQHHSAVELVDRMARKGLITRTRGDEDRREVHLQLTAAGEHVLEELTRHMRAELRSAAPALVEALRNLTARTNVASKAGRRTRKAATRRSVM